MYPQAQNTRWIDCSKTSYMLYLETSTFKKIYLSAKTWKNEKASSAQYTEQFLTAWLSSWLLGMPGMSGNTCWARAKKPFIACKNETRSLLENSSFQRHYSCGWCCSHSSQPSGREPTRDQLSAVSVGKVYNKDRSSCPVPEHPTFLYTSIAKTTHTTSKHLHETSNDEIYLFNCSQSAKSGEPLGHPALFGPPVLSWLICSSAVSWWEIFQFCLCPASSTWCCSLLVWLLLAAPSWGKEMIFWGWGDLVWQVLYSLR